MPDGGRKTWSPAGRRAKPKSPSNAKPPRWSQPRRDVDDAALLYGWHTVVAALANPARKFRRLLLTENAQRRLREDGIALPIEPEIVRPDAIARRLTADAVHQGLLAETELLEGPPLEQLPAEGVVLLLDQITDPHNVGAILRSAAAFAVTAVVMPVRYSPEATGVLAKAASGALDIVALTTVRNLVSAIATLKERGFTAVGLDSAGDADLGALDLPSPLALVLGAEGKGLRQSTRAACDHLARLDLPGRIKALNVSNAAALALYIATRPRS